MIKLTSLAASRSYRILFQSHKFITALERKVHQSSTGASPTEKSKNTEFIGRAGLYSDEVLKCTECVCGNASEGEFLDINRSGSYSDEVLKCIEGVCGNASESEFLDINKITNLNQEEELIISEDENNETIRLSDDGCTNEYETIRISTTRDAMYVAFKLLAKRGLSVTELQNVLNEKFHLDIVDEVIDDMKSRLVRVKAFINCAFYCWKNARGYLNDCLYAESFSRSRFLHSIWGPELVKQALLLKGIPDTEAEKATRRVFQDNYDYQNSMLNITISKNSSNYYYDVEEEMSQSAMEYLFLHASKHWSRQKNISIESRKASVINKVAQRPQF